MLKREDNPFLFDLIRKNYEDIDWDDLGIKSPGKITNNQITDTQAKHITSLNFDIDKKSFDEAKEKYSLKGIENFKNLESLKIHFKNEIDLLGSFNYFYNNSKNLTKLTELDINNDTVGLNFDIKNNSVTHTFKNYSSFDKLVENNEKTEQEISNTLKNGFEYNAVLNLNEAVTNVEKAINEVCNNIEPIKLQLDMKTYFRLEKNNPNLFKKLNDENCQIYVTYETMPLKMSEMSKMQKDIKSVIKDVTNTNDSDLDKIFKVYQYVSKAIAYDHKNLDLTQKDEDYFLGKINEDKSIVEKLKKIDKKSLKQKIRSPYYAMLDKTGVCTASSNLFNAFMLEMGYDAQPCYVGTKENRLNHQISRVLLPNKNWYYFDPTWDDGNRPKHFAKTKDEISTIYKAIDARENNIISGEHINSDELYDNTKQDIQVVENSHKSPIRRILDAIHRFKNWIKSPFQHSKNVKANTPNKERQLAA
ncbi:MAG: hypothetical protein IJ837_01960 [Clostridia bacterium]|nr:hypothetical protein [Clostridia bacterium]